MLVTEDEKRNTGPAAPVVGSSLLLFLVDEEEAVLEARIRQWFDDNFSSCAGVLAGTTDDGVREGFGRWHPGVGRDQSGHVDGALTNSQCLIDGTVNAATWDVHRGIHAYQCVGADGFTAPGFADGAVSDGDVTVRIAVFLDVDGVAEVAIEIPHEVGLGGRCAGGGDEGAGDSHEGCGDESCESGLARKWGHGWTVGGRDIHRFTLALFAGCEAR